MRLRRHSRISRLAGLAAAMLLWTAGGAADSAAEVYTVRGLTEPVGDVVLSVSTAGVIAAIHHGEGSFVEKGTVVLELNGRAEELEVARQRVQLKTLRDELERSELLFKTSSSVTKEELDRKRADVEVAQVTLDQAIESLARRKVVAPIAGVITLVPVKVGEYCEVGKPVARVVDTREFNVVSNVDPAQAGGLRVGQPVAIEVAAQDGTATLTGEVVYVAPVIDPASGLLRVKARFANPDLRVRPGVAGMLRITPADAASH